MGWISLANHILIPMDNTQSNHLKAYGVVYHALKKGLEVQWLLNYRGGSFILLLDADGRTECLLKGVGFEVIPPARLNGESAEDCRLLPEGKETLGRCGDFGFNLCRNSL